MTIQKTITLYTFDELSEEAKEKARNWWREASYGDDHAQEITLEDAKNIGLKIITLDQHRANKGEFYGDAVDCAKAIIANHGEMCDTYKTAKSFLLSIDSLNVEYPEDADGDRPSEYAEEWESLEREFLHSLLCDYWRMLDKEVDYYLSDENVDESIRINAYTFRENGKRED